MNRDRWISARTNANVKLASLYIISVELKPSLAITYNNQNISTVLSYSFTADTFWLWKTMCNNWRTTN